MLNNIDAIFKKERLPAVLLLFGEEEFLLEEAYLKLLAKLTKSNENSFNIENYDGGDISQNDLAAICSSFPMLAGQRIVIVKHFEKMFAGRGSKKQEEKSALGNYLNNPNDTTFLVLLSDDDSLNGIASLVRNSAQQEKADKKIASVKFPYNIILTKHEWIEFPKVYESDFQSFILSRLKKEGKTISDDAAELLAAVSPPTLRDLNSEVEKLSIFVGERTSVTSDDVHFIVGASRNNNVFELQKAIGERSIKKTLDIIENMLAADRQEMLIITMLTRYFTALWKLFEERQKQTNQYKLAAAAGVNPYFVNEYLAALNKYTAADLDMAFKALCEADLKLKTSSGSSLLILQTMIIKIIDGK